MNSKRLVLLSGPGESTNITYHALKTILPPCKVVMERPVPRRLFLRNRVKKLGWTTVAGQILFSGLILPTLKKGSRSRRAEILRQYALNTAPIPETEVIRVPSVNSEACIQELNGMKPDFVLLCGTRIVSQKVLENVPAVFLNIHAGITPLIGECTGLTGRWWSENHRLAG